MCQIESVADNCVSNSSNTTQAFQNICIHFNQRSIQHFTNKHVCVLCFLFNCFLKPRKRNLQKITTALVSGNTQENRLLPATPSPSECKTSNRFFTHCCNFLNASHETCKLVMDSLSTAHAGSS